MKIVRANLMFSTLIAACVAIDVNDNDEIDDIGVEDDDSEFRSIGKREKCCLQWDDEYCLTTPVGQSCSAGYWEVQCDACNGASEGAWVNDGTLFNPHYHCAGLSYDDEGHQFENECGTTPACEEIPLPVKCPGDDETSLSQNWHMETSAGPMCASVNGAGHHTGTSGFYPLASDGSCSLNIPGTFAKFTCEPVDGTNMFNQICQGFELGNNDEVNAGPAHEPAAQTAEGCTFGPTADGCNLLPYNCYGSWYTYPGHVYDGQVSLALCRDI